MPLTVRILSNRVSKRIVILFICAAIIPLTLLAGLTLYQIRTQLVTQHSEEIRLSAKMIGMNIFQRLQYIKDQLHLIAESLQAGVRPTLNTLSDSEAEAHSRPVSALFLLSTTGEVTDLMGGVDIDGQGLIRQVHEQRIPGKAMLLLSTGNEEGSPPSLFLFLPLEYKNRMGHLLGARLDIPNLIDSTQLDERRELICLIHENGIPLYCNKPYAMPWLAQLADRILKRERQQFTWSQQGQQLFTAYWPLFLAPHYQVRQWSVAVALPSDVVMASVSEFQKLFIQVSALTLLSVVLLSIFTVRRNMTPLEQLLEGTRRLAKGVFNAQVEIRSRDEFEELGDAFNEMALKLGTSFSRQAGLIDFSHRLQHSDILSSAMHTALETLPQFVTAEALAVIYIEKTEKLVHLECCYRLGQRTSELNACAALSEIRLPVNTWNGSVAQAHRLLPIIERMNLPATGNIQLLPAMVKDSVTAYLLFYQGEQVTADLDHYFILTQFCDILAASFSNIRLRQRLEYQAYHDPLTQLPNRTQIKRKTEGALARARNKHQQLAIMIMDIDRFKIINDSMGHAAGDRLLVELAERLQQFTSRRDVISRFAGDEFVFLFTAEDLSLHRLLPEIIERLDQAFDDPFILGNRRVRISASKGVALYPSDGETFHDLLQNADAAMYQAKHQKPGSYAFFSKDLQLNLQHELETELNLIDALTRHEFKLHYQPCIHLQSGRVLGAEALIRWYHPRMGLLLPNRFIRIAELTGLIEPMGNWVLEQACRDFLRWQETDNRLEYVAVNVSSVQLNNPAFVATVQNILQQTGMAPGRLELEITETALIDDFEATLEKLQQIRRLGVKVSVDDFGTGYASLKYLKQLPADRIKIDRLFIRDLPESQTDIAIIASLVTLSEQLGLELVAEGIETAAQKRFLLEAGIKVAQGFLLSHPLAEDEFLAFCKASAVQSAPSLVRSPGVN